MSNFSPLTFAAAVSVSGSGGGGGSGTSNYEALSNLPKINGVTLAGSKTSSDLKITSITSYTELTDKPSIAGVTLSGNKTLSELGIAGKDDIPALADSISGGVYGDILYQKTVGSTSKLNIGKNGQIITVSDNKLCWADIPDAVPKEGSMVVQRNGDKSPSAMYPGTAWEQVYII
jgi:hypothetical protein